MKIKTTLSLIGSLIISNSLLSQNIIKSEEIITSGRIRSHIPYNLVSDKTHKTVINKEGDILSLRATVKYYARSKSVPKNEFSIITKERKNIIALNTSQSLENIIVFRNNNSLKEYDKIYSSKSTNKGITVFRNYMSNSRNYLNEKFYKNNFELNSSGSIDTHQIERYKLGCGLIAIKTRSKFNKKRHLFISKTKDGKLVEIDLSKISSSFNNQNIFNGLLNTTKGVQQISSDWGIKGIFEHNNVITVFLQIKNNLLPVQIDLKTLKQQVIKNSVLSEGEFFNEHRHTTQSSGDVFYMPYSGGFVNIYSDLKPTKANMPYSFDLKLYDEKLKLITQKTLKDFYFIHHVAESSGFLIIGGYTKSKGYLGYPNPIIQIIKKSTMNITQTIVIPQKNGTVDYIGYNKTGQILIDISSPYLGYKKNENTKRVSKIIIDEIKADGTFKNNLFVH
ncbi:hypothetical protein MHM83_07775 [Tenacibaculum sp. Mcav3-52]|uniref:hypothetical protein n=1 Tax=Tenacibaculum sp. Mcav3-52 TaxID=2917762 RepID=UPI001EF3A3AD|nr:hypothetical protein [Tenacibaculum sp. Mcav3-52]MCG7501767.1 hypothetical protein [Tenacibaculum sp. Mcav3-52]